MFTLHDTPIIQNRPISSIFDSKSVFDIIIVSVHAGFYLLPDAFFYLCQIFRMHQITELMFRKMHTIIQIRTSCQLKHFLISIQDAFIILFGPVDEKGTRQVVRNIR